MNDDTVRRQSRRETEPAARELAPPARKLVFFIKETRRRCFSVLSVSQLSIRYFVAGGASPSPTTATVKFYKNKEEMYLIRYISSNFTPNHNFLRYGSFISYNKKGSLDLFRQIVNILLKNACTL